MSTFDIPALRRDKVSGPVRYVLMALALVFGLSSATVASATTVILTSGTMDEARNLNIAGIGTGIRATPVQFDGTYGGESFDNLVAFCVDVYHSISLGAYNTPLQYKDTEELKTDSNWNIAQQRHLSNIEILHVGRLVNYGTLLFYNAPVASTSQRNARWDRLAAIQGAIWQVVSGRAVSSNNGNMNTLVQGFAGANYANQFVPSYGFVHSGIKLLTPQNYPNRYGKQSFAIAAVPEPGAWALMIVGFGVTGAMLRRSRRQTAHA